MQPSFVSDYFKKTYPFLGTVKDVTRIGHNNINSINFLIKTSKGSFVLRKFVDDSPPKKIEKICEILEYCVKQKAMVPKPIMNKNKKYVDSKRKLFVTKYYHGSSFRGTSAQLKDVAKQIAFLHKTLSSVPIKYTYRTNSAYYKPLIPSELTRLSRIVRKKSSTVFELSIQNGLSRIKKISEKYSKEVKFLNAEKFKKQLIHHDLHPGNIIFNKSRVSTILDFNAMRNGIVTEDISFSALRFASQKSSSLTNIQDKIDLFINTYMKINSVDESELELMKSVLIQKILGRLGFILRKKYFKGVDIWFIDFGKNLQLLELATKLNFRAK